MILLNKSNELAIDLNSKDNFGRSAFCSACSLGHSEIVEIIMKNAVCMGIDLNINENSGGTAFHLACSEGHSETVKMIM